MKIRSVYLVYLFLIVLLIIPCVSANTNLGYPIRQSQTVTLLQTCDNCTYVNVTTLKYPNSSITYINSLMTKNGNTYSYILNASFTSNKGTYSYTTCGDLNALVTCDTVDFDIGIDLDLSKSLFYILIFLFAIGTFIGLLIAGIYLPYSNSGDAMTGYVLAVNNLKYLKIFLLCLSYVALIVILYLGYVISYSFLDMDFIGNILYFMFYASVVAALPLFVVGVYVMIANWVRDSQVADALSRGLKFR